MHRWRLPLGQKSQGAGPTSNFDSNYIEALGRHSAVKFGPGRITSVYFCQKETLETCDTTLSLSAVLSYLSFLTKCIHLVAIPHLAEYAENRSPGSRQDTLAELKGDIEGRKEVFAIGLLHSTVRKAQADRIFARENNFQRRGVVVNIPEIPQERMTLGGLGRRKQAVTETGTRRPYQWITAVMILVQIKFDKRAFYYYARCKECSAEFVGQDKRPHKRLANKNTDKKCFTIARNFFYPHDLFT
ncbi:hypothetical protein K457DRAFT_17079 [Linnemannia elongata AG-77]|uniref:Uncharacterized protein n=1 Tax=Linnemannia elongata AG-77 TaxID=1314771 RepID=A0A197K2B1_9FUNG|nr:hypothetical protein K457DRAFT_17079 [Linnemannia elongata AG-77]